MGCVHRLQVQPGEQPLPLHPGGLPVLLPAQAPDDLPRPEAHAEDAGEELRSSAPLPGESPPQAGRPSPTRGPTPASRPPESTATDSLPRGQQSPQPGFLRVPASFQGPSSLMDTETDEYMDYTGCSPGAVSSESSTMDRSCSSTPVGNESTAAGERDRDSGCGRQEGAEGTQELPAWARPLLSRPALLGPIQDRKFMVRWPQRKTGQCVAKPAVWDVGQ